MSDAPAQSSSDTDGLREIIRRALIDAKCTSRDTTVVNDGMTNVLNVVTATIAGVAQPQSTAARLSRECLENLNATDDGDPAGNLLHVLKRGFASLGWAQPSLAADALIEALLRPAQTPSSPVSFINRRLEDLAEANALYGKDQRLSAPDKIARNDREISWLKELRSMLAYSVPSTEGK